MNVDLRRAALADVNRIDFRNPGRDFWGDEAAAWDRFTAAGAGLDDTAWRLPGAAPSDAGGPDWSLLEHVAHVVDWQEIAIEYIGRAIETGRWPSDDDYEGGDFDTFNESRRPRYGAVEPAELRDRAIETRSRLLAVAQTLSDTTIHRDVAWGWVYNVLHGHAVDHLRVIEPWADRLRTRQIENDPFGVDPQPRASDLAASVRRFWADEAAIVDAFEALVRSVPAELWFERDVTPGWSLADHVGHLASWFVEGTRALLEHRRSGRWIELPAGGIDAWNATQVAVLRGTPPDVLLERFMSGRSEMRAAVRAMSDSEWLDPEAFGWAYEELHGHARAHLAMIAPWAVRLGWPAGGR